MTGSKWSGAYWGDLAERVGSTLIYALITLIPTAQIADLDAQLAWTILGVPTALSLLKGLAANMANPESGASLLGSPPVTVDEDPQVDQRGAVDLMLVLVLLVTGVVAILLFGWYDVFNIDGNGRG